MKDKYQEKHLKLSYSSYLLGGRHYLRAFLLERLLQGDFVNEPKRYTIEQFCSDLFLTKSHAKLIMSTLRTLCTKGFLKEFKAPNRKAGASSWQIQEDVINKELDQIIKDSVRNL